MVPSPLLTLPKEPVGPINNEVSVLPLLKIVAPVYEALTAYPQRTEDGLCITWQIRKTEVMKLAQSHPGRSQVQLVWLRALHLDRSSRGTRQVPRRCQCPSHIISRMLPCVEGAL